MKRDDKILLERFVEQLTKHILTVAPCVAMAGVKYYDSEFTMDGTVLVKFVDEQKHEASLTRCVLSLRALKNMGRVVAFDAESILVGLSTGHNKNKAT